NYLSRTDAPPSGLTTRVGPGHNPSSTPLFFPRRSHMRTLEPSPDLTFTADPSLCSNVHPLGTGQADRGSFVTWKGRGIKM
ncbi:unnamed protein product, partial [Bubo scandiacus]